MATWGDNGAVRAPNKNYDENYEKIFGKKESKSRREVKVLSPEQRKRQAMFPY